MCKKMVKKIIIFAAVLGMVSSVAVGCGKANGNADGTVNVANNENSGDSENKSENLEAGEKGDLGADNSGEQATGALTNEELEQIYTDFIKEEGKCSVYKDVYEGIEKGDFSYGELVAAFTAAVDDEWDESNLSDAEYAFIDCGNDSKEDLAVRLSYECDYDLLTIYLVIGYRDGKLMLDMAKQGFYRVQASVNKYGVVEVGGSSGAASYGTDYSFINSEGEEVFLYSMNVEMGLPYPLVPYYNLPAEYQEEIYSDEFFDRYEDAEGFNVETYNFEPYVYGNYYDEETGDYNDEEYVKTNFYSFVDNEGNNASPDEDLKKLYKELDIKYYDQPTVKKMINDHLTQMGCDPAFLEEDYPEWSKVASLGVGTYYRKANYDAEFIGLLTGKWKLSDENKSDEIDAVYLNIEETGDYKLDISYSDSYASPEYVKGHIYLTSSEGMFYGIDQVNFYVESTNSSETSERSVLGSFKIDEYRIEGDKAIMTLSNCFSSENLLTKYTNLKKTVYEKKYTGMDSSTKFTTLLDPGDSYVYWGNEENQKKKINPVSLSLVSETENDITDEDLWFGRLGIEPYSEDYSDGTYHYVLGGTENYGDKTRLMLYDAKTGELLHTYDFRSMMYAKGYENESFVDRSISYALVKDGYLYVNLYHNTYASSCPNNAYMLAIDLEEDRIIWKSDPLLANSRQFLVVDDCVIAGYGFSAEPHYLTIFNRYTGELIEKIDIKKSPDYFYLDGNRLYVRTYSYDYIFDLQK